MKASACFAISDLRSCMSLTTFTSPSVSPDTSSGRRALGMTPRTWRPPSWTALDTRPIRPPLPPP
uniref:Uncharacterized protein n=1 Tax=Arundo donax TaxID=35708 RepID=A0A0A8Z840_ARUDO